jgi:hypothetical protein
MKTNVRLWYYLADFFLIWEVFQTKVAEKIKAYIFEFKAFFPPENYAVYEIMWKNVVQIDRPHMTV